jgi:hypothetical protein
MSAAGTQGQKTDLMGKDEGEFDFVGGLCVSSSTEGKGGGRAARGGGQQSKRRHILVWLQQSFQTIDPLAPGAYFLCPTFSDAITRRVDNLNKCIDIMVSKLCRVRLSVARRWSKVQGPKAAAAMYYPKKLSDVRIFIPGAHSSNRRQ